MGREKEAGSLSRRKVLNAAFSPLARKTPGVISEDGHPVLVTGYEVKRHNRRAFLKKTGKVLALLALADQFPRLSEVFPRVTDSTIGFAPDQQEMFLNPNTKSAVLVFGGATVESAEGMAKVLTPVLKELGPVGYVNYAKHGFDLDSIGDEILRLKKEYGIETVSIYGHSEGPQVAGLVLKKISDKIKWGTVFLDSTPVSIESLSNKSKLGAEIMNKIDPVYDGGVLPVLIANFNAYNRNPLKFGTAHSGLLEDQATIFKYGTDPLDTLSQMSRRDKSRFIFLTPEDPAKDEIINPVAAEKELRRIFPNLKVSKVGGKKQGHANPDGNVVGYYIAIQNGLRS